MALDRACYDSGTHPSEATVHGFRSSVQDVVHGNDRDVSWAVGEAALAHTLGNSDGTGIRPE